MMGWNDALGDLDCLQTEMFRVASFVVDTGLHDKRRTREHAIEYMMAKPA